MYHRIYTFRKGRTLYYRDDFLLLGFLLIFRIQKEDVVYLNGIVKGGV
jgi:hypothetical protein